VASLGKPGAVLDIVTAIDPMADASQLASLAISDFSVHKMNERWTGGPFETNNFEQLPRDHQFQTTWWRKIRQRETRNATRLSLTVRS
jgi:hypothetical protein